MLCEAVLSFYDKPAEQFSFRTEMMVYDAPAESGALTDHCQACPGSALLSDQLCRCQQQPRFGGCAPLSLSSSRWNRGIVDHVMLLRCGCHGE
jgi:hypothetical protein